MAKKKVGKYVVDMGKKIGEGNYAKVYEAVHANTNQIVAVKILDKAKIQQCAYSLSAFKQEIDIMVRLKSQNIIKFLEVNESKTNYYIFLQLAEGGELRKKLKKNGIPQKETLEYLIQLMNGFAEMSRIGVIHRDVKPDNIFIKDGQLKIGDFGFSKDAGSTGFMTTIVGSPAYMAPQILLEQKYTYKCDVWSLGIMAYEMMTGKIPQTQTAPTKFPSDIQISEDMKNFITGCLKHNQQQRFGWTQLFLHPLFKGTFDKRFEGMEKGQQRLGYIMAAIRMNVHESKTNIKQLEKDFKKQQLTLQQFGNFIGYLNSQLQKDDIALLANVLEKDNKISFKNILQLLQKYGCKLEHVDQIVKQIDTTQPQNQKDENYLIQTKLARRNIKKAMEDKNVDLGELFLQISNNEKQINFSQFSMLLHKILTFVPESEIKKLYSKNFSTPTDKSLSLDKFNQIMNQIVNK